MARKPRLKPAPTPVLPTPRYCQFPTGCLPGNKPFASLTFKSAAGLIWTESACQFHQSHRTDQVRAEGGELVSVRLLEGDAGWSM